MQWFYCLPRKIPVAPSSKGEHLGYFVDLQSRVMPVPAVRTQKLKERIASLLDTGATARKIAGVTGTVSMGLALGPVARLWTRSLYQQVKLRQSWDRKIELTPESMRELHFWKSCLEEFNGQPIWPTTVSASLSNFSQFGAKFGSADLSKWSRDPLLVPKSQ